MKTKLYKIVTAKDDQWLESKVNDLLPKGWEPLGAPFVGQSYAHQAMVMISEDSWTGGPR